jgi:hypothetical protein
MNTFETIIKDYIEKACASDEVLAGKYEKSGKDIAGCCKYIKSQARKKAQNGCAAIADAEVFGWAIHYFDEGLKAPEDAPKAEVKVTADPNVVRVQPTPKPVVAKPKPKKADEGMMSLFSFDDEEE